MKHKIYYLIILLFINLFSLNSYAENKDKNEIYFDVASLDQAWNNRESKKGEDSILKFIQNVQNIPENFDVAWRISRLVYFIGNFGPGENLSNDEHIKVFELGYKAGEIAKNLQPNRVEGYYWYAINLGKYSLAVGLFKALRTAPMARDALVEAAKIDPSYHWAGAYRILGRYYQDLPSGISFGDKKKAEEYLTKAIQISPNFRLNTAYLASLESDKDLKLKLFKEAENKPNTDGTIEEERYKEDLKLDIEKLN